MSQFVGFLIFFLGGSVVSKSPPEMEEQLGDCAELDDKSSWFWEVTALLPFPLDRRVNFAPTNDLLKFKKQNTKIYLWIPFKH